MVPVPPAGGAPVTNHEHDPSNCDVCAYVPGALMANRAQLLAALFLVRLESVQYAEQARS